MAIVLQIAHDIETHRIRLGLSKTDLANILDVGISFLSYLSKNAVNVSDVTYQKFECLYAFLASLSTEYDNYYKRDRYIQKREEEIAELKLLFKCKFAQQKNK